MTTLEHVEVFFLPLNPESVSKNLNPLSLMFKHVSFGEGKRAPNFWVGRVEGVKIRGASGSVETGTKGLALIISVTSAIRIIRTS